MAAGWIQGSGNVATTAATTVAKAYASAVTPGNFLVCRALWANATQTCTVSDSVNGAWTALASTIATNATGGTRVEVFYKENTAAGTPTVTATSSGTNSYRVIDIAEFSGMLTASAVDGVGAAATGNSTAPSASFTTTVDHDLVVGGCWVANTSSASAPTVASSITDGNGFGYVLDKTPAGAQAIAWTQATGQWGANVAAFKIAAAAATKPSLTMAPLGH